MTIQWSNHSQKSGNTGSPVKSQAMNSLDNASKEWAKVPVNGRPSTYCPGDIQNVNKGFGKPVVDKTIFSNLDIQKVR